MGLKLLGQKKPGAVAIKRSFDFIRRVSVLSSKKMNRPDVERNCRRGVKIWEEWENLARAMREGAGETAPMRAAGSQTRLRPWRASLPGLGIYGSGVSGPLLFVQFGLC
jgi:hypothetical protein